jgi:hypothetical protein
LFVSGGQVRVVPPTPLNHTMSGVWGELGPPCPAEKTNEIKGPFGRGQGPPPRSSLFRAGGTLSGGSSFFQCAQVRDESQAGGAQDLSAAGRVGARGYFCAVRHRRRRGTRSHPTGKLLGTGSHPHGACPGEACNGTAPASSSSRTTTTTTNWLLLLLLLLLLFKKGRPRGRDSVERRSFRSTPFGTSLLPVPWSWTATSCMLWRAELHHERAPRTPWSACTPRRQCPSSSA